MRIALFQPDIAGNVGTILRLCACLGVPLEIIEPCGFPLSDKALRRAAMDYADAAAFTRHADWTEFGMRRPERKILLTTRADESIHAIAFQPDDILIFGSESAGAPQFVHDEVNRAVRIPLRPGFRSLNIAVAAGIALGEALRQTKGFAE